MSSCYIVRCALWTSVIRFLLMLRKKILPSNQEQIIGQAKFTYFPLGKAFQNKQNQIKIKEKNKSEQLKITKKLANTKARIDKNELLLLKEREIFKEIFDERLNKTEILTNKNNYGDLNFIVQSSGDETSVKKVDDPVVFLNDIKKRQNETKRRKKITRRF